MTAIVHFLSQGCPLWVIPASIVVGAALGVVLGLVHNHFDPPGWN